MARVARNQLRGITRKWSRRARPSVRSWQHGARLICHVRPHESKMADKSADQVKAERLDRLGPKLGPVFHALSDDLAWLQVKWAEYRQLFGTSPERIDLLNSAAGLFFRVLQDTLWEDALLHIARLTDAADVGGRRNLTVRALPALCEDPILRERVSQLVDDAVAVSAFARDWRNRHIGHRDLTLAVDSTAKPLSPASRSDVSAALAALHSVFNEITERMFDSTLADDVVTPDTGAEALLYVIRDGLEVEDARRKRIESGQITQDDLHRHAV